MSSKMSIRFYSVEKLKPAGPALRTALEQIISRDHSAREKQLTGGLVVRLERFAPDAGELAGEFIKVTDTDFPFEVGTDGVRRLPTEGPIGFGVAFRYRPGDHTLAMQYNPRVVSPGRAIDYLMQVDNRFAYKVTPKMDEENWRKFNENPIRKLRIGIASPQNLAAIEDAGSAVMSSARQLGEAYSAPVITIEMGMGTRKGSLSAAARGAAAAFAGLFNQGADIRSLKGWVKLREGESAEELNLIDEVLSTRAEFPSPRNDPDGNYRVRAEILKQALAAHGS